jgi:hypothetical protein
MANPISGITIKFETEGYAPTYIDNKYNQVNVVQPYKEVTNYEYEVQENEKKRKILILKPEYLGVFISDMRNIMKYDKSSDYIDSNTKKVYNSKLTGV